MNIQLKRPYKIVPERLRRYEAHYSIPAARSLIIPLKSFGDEVSCDILWEDDNGYLHALENKISISERPVPLNPLPEGSFMSCGSTIMR